VIGRFRFLPYVACLSLFALHAGDRHGATGTMHLACSIFPYRLVLTRFEDRMLDGSIEIDLPSFDWPQIARKKQWTEVPGMQCSSDAKCVGLEAKILITRFPHWGSKTVSGQFATLFSDGSKFEGPFQARYLKPPQPLIREDLNLK